MRALFRIVRAILVVVVIAAIAYGIYVAAAWIGFGHAKRVASPAAAAISMDRFLPAYDVTERHETRVRAPAPVTFAAARDLDLQQSPLVRAIFKGRQLILGSHGQELERRSFLSQVQGMGWGLLAEVPGRAIVFGAVTRPWEANVKFHPLPPAQFAALREPGWAKIVWTLEVDPAGAGASVFRTQTRVATTDAHARKRFRQYWATLSPGILLIRQQALGLVKSEAERKARAGASSRGTS